MSELGMLPNIGRIMEQKLIDAGVDTVQDLRSMGSEAAFQRLLLQEPEGCFNMLCALEGAIQGIRWHYLPQERIRELRRSYDSMKRI